MQCGEREQSVLLGILGEEVAALPLSAEFRRRGCQDFIPLFAAVAAHDACRVPSLSGIPTGPIAASSRSKGIKARRLLSLFATGKSILMGSAPRD